VSLFLLDSFQYFSLPDFWLWHVGYCSRSSCREDSQVSVVEDSGEECLFDFNICDFVDWGCVAVSVKYAPLDE